MRYILPATLFCGNIGALPSSDLEGRAIHHLHAPVVGGRWEVGGGWFGGGGGKNLIPALAAVTEAKPVPLLRSSEVAAMDGSSPR